MKCDDIRDVGYKILVIVSVGYMTITQPVHGLKHWEIFATFLVHKIINKFKAVTSESTVIQNA